jgi:glycosyltransferase involved in cell wall biosynthesis
VMLKDDSLKIGIDAKWYVNGPVSGSIVVRSLVRELLALPTRHEWYLFLPAADVAAFPHYRPGVHPVACWAGNNLLANLTVVPRAAHRLRLDAVLYQNFVPPWGRGARIGLIYDAIFASDPQCFGVKERLHFSPMKRLARGADRICTISTAERERLVGHGFAPRGRIDVALLGVDPAFRPLEQQAKTDIATRRAAMGLPEEFILFVGRLNRRKNIMGLLRALAVRSGAPVPCLIVGAPDGLGDDLLSEVRALGLEEQVRFVGPTSFDDLVALFALATVFCSPSFTEGFGMPVLEAMASGTPVVASRIGSHEEVCGDAAVYCDPADPASIARGLDTVLRDVGLRRRLRAAGLARAQEFTWKRAATAVLSSVERAVRR